MPINSRDALGVPPDGAGKKLQVGRTIVVDYTGAASANEFRHGDEVVGSISGLTGTVIGFRALSVDTGSLDVYLNPKTLDIGTFTIGETLSGLATVGFVEDKYISQSMIVGGNDPLNQMSVDENGSVNTRFKDGDPSLDLMGAQLMSRITALGSYHSQYEDTEDEFGYIETGTTSHAHNTATRGVLLTAGAGAGNEIIRRTNWTHYYQQGASMTARMAVACPDVGKTSVLRRWGMFDDANGVGFGLHGGVLGIGYRSNVTGTPVDVFIPQAQWNGDRLNGMGGASNLSVADIDPAMTNAYWVEYRWYGTASVKFGVFLGGEKIICHELDLQNSSALPAFPYMSFPLSYQVLTTGATASGTDMLVYGATVESSNAITQWTSPKSMFSEPKALTYGGGFKPILSIRAADLYHGIKNDVWAGITSCNVSSLTSDYTADQFTVFKAVYDPILTGASWATDVESAVEADVSATAADTDGCAVISMWLAKGSQFHRFPAASIFDADGVGLNADGTPTTITILARPLSPASSSSVSAVLSWEELR